VSARIEAVLLDLGGVLIEIVGADRMLAWSPALPDMATMWNRWLASPTVRAYETGRLARAAFARGVIEEFGLDVDDEAFLAEFARWPRRMFEGTPALLEDLRRRFRIASLSNTNELHWDRFERDWSLSSRFDANFPSHAVGRLKPDADYFEHVLAMLGVAPGNAVFLDDHPVNVAAAAKVGLVARRALGPQGVRAALAELGLDSPHSSSGRLP
jgi:putative hydrolase of the HAD superfamily